MPVILRSPNNSNTDVAILGTLRSVLNLDADGTPCTYLAQLSQSQTGLELVYVQSKYKMALGMTATVPYAVHLSSGKQSYRKNSLRTYDGSFEALIEYCGRWDDQPTSIDAIRATIAADLERLKANLETNDSLSYGGQAYAISLPSMTLSDYKGELDTTFPGLTLVSRTLSVMVNVLPYACLS